RCINGSEIPCLPDSPAVFDARCDGVDDDCDGRTDEDYAPVAGCGIGVCLDGSVGSQCVDGVETPCREGPPTGGDDDCDGIDDDCDGNTDESVPTIAGEVRVTLDAASATRPRLARRADGSAVVWSARAGDTSQVYFLRLDPAGQRVGDIVQVSEGRGNTRPDIAAGPGNFVVAWQSTRTGIPQIHAATLGLDGAILRADALI
ncbi:MAG: hypothetical protein KC620_26950, partial [Myxococcales bacterium]|nr:hypothetical protein [Myxococcales bacterium]